MSDHGFSEPHGGLDCGELATLGLRASQVLDFSVSSNPFGPSPRVLRAIRGVDVSRYPDRGSPTLVAALSRANGVDPARVLVGNGTAELIWLAAAALVAPGDLVLIAGPTFGEYARACAAFGARIVEVRAEPPDFVPPISAAAAAISARRPTLAFVCNPNNPTGKLIDPEGVAELARSCGDQTTLVVDEAYRGFAGRGIFGPPPEGVALVLRSMTKDCALAGLRLGYALGKESLLARLAERQPAWSVNALAQAAGEAALSDLGYYRRTLERLGAVRERFYAALRERGLRLVDSGTHFAIMETDGPARGLRRRLLERGIQVRDCSSFGLPCHVRVSTRLPAHNRRLLRELARLP